MLTIEIIEDYRTWFLLKDKGETITIPLRTVEQINDENFEAVYEYNGTLRRDEISENEYHALKSKRTISVRVYGNISQVVQWNPDHSMNVIPLMIWSWGLLIVARSLWDAYVQFDSAAYQLSTVPPIKRAPTRFGLTKRHLILAYARWRNWKTPPPAIKGLKRQARITDTRKKQKHEKRKRGLPEG
jgi:hypothetical protein